MGFDLHFAFSLQPHGSWNGVAIFITIATPVVLTARWLWQQRPRR